MDWLASLIGGGAKGMLEGIGSMAKGIREAIVGPELTSEQKTQIEMQLAAMEAAAQKAAQDVDAIQAAGQIDLNKLDAQSGDRFRSWPRPAAMWTCVIGLAYSFLVQPLLPWTVQTIADVTGRVAKISTLPSLNTEVLMTLACSLLGIGGYRMWEKVKGKA